MKANLFSNFFIFNLTIKFFMQDIVIKLRMGKQKEIKKLPEICDKAIKKKDLYRFFMQVLNLLISLSNIKHPNTVIIKIPIEGKWEASSKKPNNVFADIGLKLMNSLIFNKIDGLIIFNGSSTNKI